jgi:mono/diheme cytochrome c family protein/cytochrome c553
VNPRDSAPDPVVTGPDGFLLFPNPQVQSDGTLQTNTAAYTNAYYAALDPLNERATLEGFKAKNGFGSGTGEEVTFVFGDVRDLGYGRRMNVRRNPNGSIAFFVENYLALPGAEYAYSPLNLDAAVVRDTRWLVGINAIEFGPGPNGGSAFPRWYNYQADTLQRATFVDLDGRGGKAMPGPCISCHGGRGDALTPADSTGKSLFNLVQNAPSGQRGDVTGRLHPFEADAFEFSSRPGFTRAEQEAAIKKVNQWILCTYPLPAPSTAPEDQCRRPATESEWQGTAAAFIKAAYGGDGLPSATFNDTFVPESWVVNGQTSLYRNVIAPACRTCHMMRGTGGNANIDFTDFNNFKAYADRVKYHVFERGNMPLAKIVYDAFWSTPSRPEALARFLESQGLSVRRDASGVVQRPGNPVAVVGPDRLLPLGATVLSASQSLYATGYNWTLVAGPAGGATLTGAATATPTFTASAEGTYTLRLVATNGTLQSAPATLTVVVKASLSPAPSAIRFADIKAVLQGGQCVNCHSPTGALPRPPVFYTNTDRNADGIAGDATDDAWFYAEIRSRINFTDVVSSALLRKPSGNHHGGLLQTGFDTSVAPGNAARDNYDLFVNWIAAGAPR